MTYSKYWKEKAVNLGFYIPQNHPSKKWEKLGYSQVNRNWENSLLADPPYKKSKGSPSGWIERPLENNSNSHKEIKAKGR